MSYTAKDLDHAIYSNSYKILKQILKTSPMLIDKTCSKKNTLNKFISSILNNKNLCGFSTKTIEILFKQDVQPVNKNSVHNTLHCAIIWSKHYIDSFKRDKRLLAEQNAIKVLDLVIKNGATPITCESKDTINININTLSTIIGTGNPKIIRTVVESKIGVDLAPDNGNYDNTFEHALFLSQKYKQYELFLIAIKYGALPKKDISHTLANLHDQMMIQRIIKDCIVIIGKQFIERFQYSYSLHDNLCKNTEINVFNDIVEMLMCSGMRLPIHMKDIKLHHTAFSSDYVEPFIAFQKLSNGPGNHDDFKKVTDLKHRLGEKTNQLVDIATHGGNNRKILIEKIIMCMPICLTDIIFGYQIIEPKFDVIDWSKR